MDRLVQQGLPSYQSKRRKGYEQALKSDKIAARNTKSTAATKTGAVQSSLEKAGVLKNQAVLSPPKFFNTIRSQRWGFLLWVAQLACCRFGRHLDRVSTKPKAYMTRRVIR